MARTIEDLSPKELRNFIARYEEVNKTEGGVYPLRALLVEQLRRAPGTKAPREVVRFIVETASVEPTGTLSYGQLWSFLHPDMPWKGNHSVKVVSDTLNTAIAYCVRHDLPLVTTLVVQTGSRKLSDEAITKTHEEARRYGYVVGPIAATFVAEQAERSRRLTAEMLPAD